MEEYTKGYRDGFKDGFQAGSKSDEILVVKDNSPQEKAEPCIQDSSDNEDTHSQIKKEILKDYNFDCNKHGHDEYSRCMLNKETDLDNYALEKERVK